MQLFLQKHSLERLTASGQTLTFLIDPTLATLGLTVCCEAGWSDGAYLQVDPHQNNKQVEMGQRQRVTMPQTRRMTVGEPLPG